MKSVKISIITVSFNAIETIKETIDSVLNQKDELVEYIIVDGGSRDGTLDIIQSYGNQIDKVISEPDKGISDAFNKGIRHSSGDLIGIINSDDVLYKDSIDTVRRLFFEDPDIEILYGDMEVFSDYVGNGRLVKADTDLNKLRYAFLIPHPGMFITRKAYNQYGLYDVNYKNAMDYELVSRMYIGGAKLKYTGKVLAAFREGGVSQIALGRTIKEHRTVAKRNGSGFIKREIYLAYIYLRHIATPLLKQIGIENTLHKIIKGY